MKRQKPAENPYTPPRDLPCGDASLVYDVRVLDPDKKALAISLTSLGAQGWQPLFAWPQEDGNICVVVRRWG